ncbi:hypothetical protein FHY55_12285 [Oceanicola sp. D3]|uniref:hypothetical protein n=1 Tax=Oceanicola sp. D3 TaxID=2587163 RepID=UPI0011240215|nr:hypothetical protein [Oceanicola sp. D3]QDC09972.1 hypothetical protein FHY55_12285 [Oceanicola sp. D3]
MKRLCIALACLATPAAAEIPPWAGFWAADPAWCANTQGEVPEAPIYLADTEFAGYENGCDIVVAEPHPSGSAWSVTMSCMGEGESYERDVLLMLSADDHLFWWDEGYMVERVRCR